MTAPKVLTLVDQLKLYRPNYDFRIEVAQLPGHSTQIDYTTDRRMQNRAHKSAFLSEEDALLSESSVDTMSSVSDDNDIDGKAVCKPSLRYVVRMVPRTHDWAVCVSFSAIRSI